MCVCVYTLVKKSHFPSETKSIQLAIDRKARAFERKIDAISPGSHRSSCCSPMRFRSKFNVSFANLEDFRSSKICASELIVQYVEIELNLKNLVFLPFRFLPNVNVIRV